MSASDPDTSAASTSKTLARSAGLVGIATMASRVLGLARDVLYAGLFGAGDVMDAFTVAFRIPNLLRDLFAEGAMSAAFVPAFTRALTNQGRDAAWRLGRRIISLLLLVTFVVTVAGVVFTEPLSRWYAGDYALVPGKLELTVHLTRIMFPFLMLVALAVACMGMLNALRHFFVPALSPALFNVGAIVAAVAFVPIMPALGLHPATGLAIGTLLGGFLQFIVQWPALRREGFRFRFELAPRDPAVREVLLLMIPSTVGLAAVQINQFVNTLLATGEGTGAVSWLNFSFRLMYLPIGLFGVSVAAASLPTLSADAARGDLAAMRRTLSSGMRLMLMLNVPATVGLMALATPIVALIFERGAFTRDDTAATAAALLCYAPGLLGYSAVKLASPAFYALRDARTPVTTSILSMLVNVGLNVALVGPLGYRGLALGTALAAMFNAVVLVVLLRRRLGGLDERRIGASLARILAASLTMGAVAMGVDRALQPVFATQGFAGHLVHVCLAIAAGVIALAVAARVLGVSEFTDAVRLVRERVTRRRGGGSGQA
jgi:putative peptidoglycan lipid II flippase